MCAAEHKHNDKSAYEIKNKLRKPKQFEINIGKYIFEWQCDVFNKTLRITATETITKDKFSSHYTMKQLKEMKFFKSDTNDIKNFIEKVMFNHTNEMFHQIAFVPYATQMEGDGLALSQTNEYTANDKMLIILNYQNEWISNKWELTLHYVPQKAPIKLESIIRDLQFQNRTLTQKIESMQHNLVPKGTIVMWNGSIHNIPNGWRLCDGGNSTPDLRDKFVLGAGGQHDCGKNGGNKSHSHNVAVHGTKLHIKHMPQHKHNVKRQYWDIQSGGGGNKYRVLCANSEGDRSLWTNYVGGGESHGHSSFCTHSESMPPYITLGYIMKI